MWLNFGELVNNNGVMYCDGPFLTSVTASRKLPVLIKNWNEGDVSYSYPYEKVPVLYQHWLYY